ncbi:hypothetical protein C0J52_26613 [Blattella germanica]|nr:hypothetical protein C0J52_26613 [Blattella germanica]
MICQSHHHQRHRLFMVLGEPTQQMVISHVHTNYISKINFKLNNYVVHMLMSISYRYVNCHYHHPCRL